MFILFPFPHFPKQFLVKNCRFSNDPKKAPINWATFVRKFAVKIFQKDPNLVKLITYES